MQSSGPRSSYTSAELIWSVAVSAESTSAWGSTKTLRDKINDRLEESCNDGFRSVDPALPLCDLFDQKARTQKCNETVLERLSHSKLENRQSHQIPDSSLKGPVDV